MRRKPCVAGFFYPRNPDSLRSMIQRMIDAEAEKKKALAVISPHAGYEYSGSVAGHVFSSVELPRRFVILGPSHRDIPVKMAIMSSGVWEMPLGEVPVDSDLASLIMAHTAGIEEDAQSHLNEHSLEVQVPFLQYFAEHLSIVPISISYMAAYEDLQELGLGVAKAIKEAGDEIMIVASTDMSHYVTQEEAKKKDFLAIDKILNLDPKGLYDVVKKERISMCGIHPTTAALVASQALDAQKAELIMYQTSGDVSGNFVEVVGYAGLRIV